jgi:hypothetical protein
MRGIRSARPRRPPLTVASFLRVRAPALHTPQKMASADRPPDATRPVDPAEVAALVLHYLAGAGGFERSAGMFRR